MRLVALIAIFCLLSVALIGRLAYWQLGQRDRLLGLARSQLERTVIEPSERGSIYDRTGTVVLATTVSRDLLWATPSEIPDARRGNVADALIGIVGAKGSDAEQLRASVFDGRPYLVVAREITPAQSELVRAGLHGGSLVGVGLDPTPVRSFPTAGGGPGTSLASQLLGFVDSAGNGRYGVEQRWQAVLAGTPRRSLAQFDAIGRPISATQQVTDPGTPGADLQLTIDASLQLKFEQELLASGTAHQAAFASAVAMDPYTGEILAWATSPGYEAADYRTVADSDPNRFSDPIVSQVYEPGSVFKMFTTLAGLETGAFTLKSRFNDTGELAVAGGRIFDADHKARGVMSVEDIVAFSRNVGAARMAMKLGPDIRSAAAILYETWQAMGFGRSTGVAVTQLQLVQAYAAMVNGGVLVTPHVVRMAAGDQLEPAPGRRVMSDARSSQLTALLRHVVTTVPSYARGTLIAGEDVGGKTGTAQIWDSAAGQYMSDHFNLSFVGFVGKDGPRVLIAVRIGDAVGSISALPVNSHEVFRRLAQDAMDTLDLPAASEVALEDGAAQAAGRP